MGYRGAAHWDRAAKDGAQGLQLLGIQGGTNADEIYCICSGKAGEQGGAKLLHRCHIVGCQLTDGFQVALALARVLGKATGTGLRGCCRGGNGAGVECAWEPARLRPRPEDAA